MLTFLEAKNSMPLATWYEKLRRSSVSRDRPSSSNISLSASASTYEPPAGQTQTGRGSFPWNRVSFKYLSVYFNTEVFDEWQAPLAFVQRASLLGGRAERRLASSRRPHGHVAVQAVSVKRKRSSLVSAEPQPHIGTLLSKYPPPTHVLDSKY